MARVIGTYFEPLVAHGNFGRLVDASGPASDVDGRSDDEAGRNDAQLPSTASAEDLHNSGSASHPEHQSDHGQSPSRPGCQAEPMLIGRVPGRVYVAYICAPGPAILVAVIL